MNCFEIILIALGLAMDAFAVSIASGVTLQKFKFRIAFRVAFFFGFFQAIMPLIGWFAGINSVVSSQQSTIGWLSDCLLSSVAK